MCSNYYIFKLQRNGEEMRMELLDQMEQIKQEDEKEHEVSC